MAASAFLDQPSVCFSPHIIGMYSIPACRASVWDAQLSAQSQVSARAASKPKDSDSHAQVTARSFV